MNDMTGTGKASPSISYTVRSPLDDPIASSYGGESALVIAKWLLHTHD